MLGLAIIEVNNVEIALGKAPVLEEAGQNKEIDFRVRVQTHLGKQQVP